MEQIEVPAILAFSWSPLPTWPASDLDFCERSREFSAQEVSDSLVYSVDSLSLWSLSLACTFFHDLAGSTVSAASDRSTTQSRM